MLFPAQFEVSCLNPNLMAPGSSPPEFTACASKSDPQRDECTGRHLAVSPNVFLRAAGRHLAGLAIVAGVFDLASGRQINKPILPRALCYALAVLLSLINAFVHSRDGYTAVVPTGLTLSGLVVVIVLLMGLMGSTSAYRHHT